MTQDTGNSWVKIKDSVISYGWGDAGEGEVPEGRIYMITITRSEAIPFNMIQTDSYGANEEVLVAHSYQFIFLQHQAFAMVVRRASCLILLVPSKPANFCSKSDTRCL